MKLKNGPIRCPYCHCLSGYCVIDRLSGIRKESSEDSQQPEGSSQGWELFLQTHKKKAFCLMCHKTMELPVHTSRVPVDKFSL